MKTIKSFKKFGKLCFLALDLAEIEKLYHAGQVDRYREARALAVENSGLDINNSINRRLYDMVAYSVKSGRTVPTIIDSPFWDMNDSDFAAFMNLLDKFQIHEFIYESRDSAAYRTFYRLDELGWKITGLTRRLTGMGKYKEHAGKKLSSFDYEYGITIKKTTKK